MARSPFPRTASKAGHGQVHLTLLPPATPTFTALSFTYPLKLLPSAPHTLRAIRIRSEDCPETGDNGNKVTNGASQSGANKRTGTEHEPFGKEQKIRESSVHRPHKVPLLFLLTYGGGLLAGDATDIDMTLDVGTRLTAATQGMTRIYAPPSEPDHSTKTRAITSQSMNVHLHAHSALWLAPDPVQPFARSTSVQNQYFHLHDASASVGLIDWVCEGRKSRGESWTLDSWRSRNELWMDTRNDSKDSSQARQEKNRRRLLVRDSITVSGNKQKGFALGHAEGSSMMDGKGIFGSVLLYGEAFRPLAEFFVQEFEAMDRIGAKQWDPAPASSSSAPHTSSFPFASTPNLQPLVKEESHQTWRHQRQILEKIDGILWTATRLARDRGGVTIIKFGATEVEGGRKWLGDMLKREGTIASEFGDSGLMFTR